MEQTGDIKHNTFLMCCIYAWWGHKTACHAFNKDLFKVKKLMGYFAAPKLPQSFAKRHAIHAHRDNFEVIQF